MGEKSEDQALAPKKNLYDEQNRSNKIEICQFPHKKWQSFSDFAIALCVQICINSV